MWFSPNLINKETILRIRHSLAIALTLPSTFGPMPSGMSNGKSTSLAPSARFRCGRSYRTRPRMCSGVRFFSSHPALSSGSPNWGISRTEVGNPDRPPHFRGAFPHTCGRNLIRGWHGPARPTIPLSDIGNRLWLENLGIGVGILANRFFRLSAGHRPST